jgi:hypothetical protein
LEKQLEINPQEDLTMAALLQAMVDYRQGLGIDTQWAECIKKDLAYAANDVIGGETASIRRTISLPIIRNNNNRKVAAIGSVNAKPVIYSESYGGDAFSEIRSGILRWGIRVSGLEDAIVFTSRPLVMLAQGCFQLVWDDNALDGQGAPVFEVKDTRNIFVDGRRRQWDINRECRIIAEKQRYTRAECEEYWPDYFKDVSGALVDLERQSITTESAVDSTSPIEGGEIDLMFVEYAAQSEDGRKIVKAGIFDLAGKGWVKKPYDTKLGMFSYIINGLPPDMGQAYPVPPNLAEHELARLTNLAYTLFVHTAFKNADGPVFYDPENAAFAKWLKTHRQFELGEFVPSDEGKVPGQQLELQGQEEFLRAAQTLHAIANDSSDVQSVQRGEAPRGVSSGRALGILTSSADLSMEQYRQAVKRAYVQACSVMDRMLRIKIPGYRELIARDGQQVNRIPVNVAEGTDQYNELKSAMEDGQAVGYESARMYKTDDEGEELYVGSASIAEASAKYKTSKITSFKKFINDITVGNLEVDVEIEPIASRAERKQQAMLARQTESIDLITYLSELGYDNPQVIVERLMQENQAMQVGTAVTQSPELMTAIQVLSQDPLLMKLVTDPQARGEFKVEMAHRAIKSELQSPRDGQQP